MAWTGTQARRNADKLGSSDLRWHGLNRQLPNLETGALAIELHSSGSACGGPEARRRVVNA